MIYTIYTVIIQKWTINTILEMKAAHSFHLHVGRSRTYVMLPSIIIKLFISAVPASCMESSAGRHPRQWDPSPVALLQASCFSLKGFGKFFLTWPEGWRTEGVPPVQVSKPSQANKGLGLWALKSEYTCGTMTPIKMQERHQSVVPCDMLLLVITNQECRSH